MAATTHLNATQTHTSKPKRRKRRETTITTTATSNPQPPPSPLTSTPPNFYISSPSPTKFMDSPTPTPIGVANSIAYTSYPSNYTKFNCALNAGLLNPMSPPPRSSPTLFEMMANEPDSLNPSNPRSQMSSIYNPTPFQRPQVVSVQDKQLLLHQRLAEMLGSCSPESQFNDPVSSDVKLTLTSKDGVSVSMNVHRQILVGNSSFFADKLSDRWSKQQRSLPHIVEILECDDVEVYVETLRLMYCKDFRRRLIKEDVSKVLGILKVSAAIEFNAGVLSCLEYLEAVPWAEDEEEKVALLLSQLHLPGTGAGEVLKRVSAEMMAEPDEGSKNEEVLLKLLHVVLEGKDEKARRDMKGLVLKMLRENSSQNELTKESLYAACDGCLQLLRLHFLRAAAASVLDLNDVNQLSRQADNLHWILDIMIDRQIADDFLKTWADQSELSAAHSKVLVIHRYEVSRVTARLFVGIGKGQLLASKEVRCMLLQTWLEPFYDDFGWMRRASNGLDRHLVEDGLSNTILTLPLAWQQEILLVWFDRFLNSGEDCPNIQRGFQVWWRRAFWRRYGDSEQRH